MKTSSTALWLGTLKFGAVVTVNGPLIRTRESGESDHSASALELTNNINTLHRELTDL